MLIMSEVPGTTFTFRLYRGKKFIKDLSVDDTVIITSGDLPGFKDKKLSVTLRDDSRKPLAEISRAVMINGVSCRKKRLKRGDTIFLGPYRLVFSGEVFPEIPAPAGSSVRKKSRLPYIAEAAVLLISLSFLWYCTTQMPVRKSAVHPAPADTARLHEAPPPESAPEGEKTPEQPGSSAAGNVLAVYSPGEFPSPRKIDILFLHTHPDDETLDYGLLISEAADSGKSVGVITFTDGESGFDFYPDRSTGGMYPDRELSGEELAGVRVREEEAALKILGVSVYVRLGLKNRPYTREEASKSISRIIEEWGGEDYLVNRISGLIALFSPDIIVSPDGPSGAREHFEHEAAGYLCDLAVHSYILSHPGRLRAYLKLIDVQQLDAYPGVKIIRADSRGDNGKYLARKKSALLKYQTQADACYYGVKRLEKYPYEYYFAVYETKDINLAFLSGQNNEKYKGQ